VSGKGITPSHKYPPRWWVVCDRYRLGPLQSPEQAQRALDRIAKIGACREEHTIIEEER
jgi:hypothetical protein